jgi:acyl dehydratase
MTVLETLAVGESASPVVLKVSRATVLGAPVATWDFFPGHHDPDYARRQGQRDVYVSTMIFNGFIDRVAVAVTGPEWFVRRRKTQMSQSVFPGDVLVGVATLKGRSTTESGQQAVRLSIVASTDRGPCLSAEIVLTLDR